MTAYIAKGLTVFLIFVESTGSTSTVADLNVVFEIVKYISFAFQLLKPH